MQFFCKQRFEKLNNVLTVRWKLSADVDLYNTRDRTQDILDPRSYLDFQDPRLCQDIQNEIQDLTKEFKMSRQNLRSFQDVQECKIFLRSWRDIHVVERWERTPNKCSSKSQNR